MLLYNPCCMMVGGLLETPTKEEVTFIIAIFPTGVTYDVNSNKPDCVKS